MHDRDETLLPARGGSITGKQKFSSSASRIPEGVAGNLGHGCRNANLLLAIKAQGGGDDACPISAKHNILFALEGHQHQARASVRCIKAHSDCGQRPR